MHLFDTLVELNASLHDRLIALLWPNRELQHTPLNDPHKNVYSHPITGERRITHTDDLLGHKKKKKTVPCSGICHTLQWNNLTHSSSSSVTIFTSGAITHFTYCITGPCLPRAWHICSFPKCADVASIGIPGEVWSLWIFELLADSPPSTAKKRCWLQFKGLLASKGKTELKQFWMETMMI